MKRPNSSNPNSLNKLPTSYQQGYRPAVHYAADQTRQMEDTTQAYYQADETAARILGTMQGQRTQITNAHEDVRVMKDTTDQAKRELMELQKKYKARKQKLYVTIGILGVTDLLLLLRIFQCRGNFYC